MSRTAIRAILISAITFFACISEGAPAHSFEACTSEISAVRRELQILGAAVASVERQKIANSPFDYAEEVVIQLGYATTGYTITQSIVADHILLYNDDYARFYAERIIAKKCPNVVSFTIQAYEYASNWVLMPDLKIKKSICVDPGLQGRYSWGTIPCL